MNAQKLHSLLSSADRPALLHVLPPEIFAQQRIAGSLNACVFEIAFQKTVEALVAEKNRRIVVYGAGNGSLDAKVAQEKLLEAGYLAVEILDEGLAGWRSADFPLEGDLASTTSPKVDGLFTVDPTLSVIRWTGRNLFNHHSGSLRLQSGSIQLRNGQLHDASFVIDMETITCEDIPNAAMNTLLISHLKNADFFETSRHPTATFVSQRAEPIIGASEGRPNFLLHGSLNLRGITKEITFPIVVAFSDENQLTGQGTLDLDRTEFGSTYGSGRFFQFLGKHVVNDHVHLHLKIQAPRSS